VPSGEVCLRVSARVCACLFCAQVDACEREMYVLDSSCRAACMLGVWSRSYGSQNLPARCVNAGKSFLWVCLMLPVQKVLF